MKLKILPLWICIVFSFLKTSNCQYWSYVGSSISTEGVDVDAYAIAFNSTGYNVFVGGNLMISGDGQYMNRIASWNGSKWSPLNQGVSGTVSALIFDGSRDRLIIGGGTYGLSQWDGSNFTAIGGGVGGTVWCMALDQTRGNLYVGGAFQSVGGGSLNVSYLAMWNGTAWRGFGYLNYYVTSLTVDFIRNYLYIGGDFQNVSSLTNVNGIAYFDGSSWNKMGTGVNRRAEVLFYHPAYDQVFVGSNFKNFPNGTTNNDWNIARWSHSTGWQPQPVNPSPVIAMSFYYDSVRNITYAGISSSDSSLLSFNGTSWNVVGVKGTKFSGDRTGSRGTEGIAVNVSDGTVFVCGQFQSAGNFPASYVAKYVLSGTAPPNNPIPSPRWTPVGSLDDSVSALIYDQPSNLLYAGGYFINADSQVVNRIAKWNGTKWSPLGSGFNNQVACLCFGSTKSIIYAGGSFNLAGAISVSYVAMWSGSSWSALGSGVFGYVNAIAYSQSILYVVGSFPTPGRNIAKWDGISWTNLTTGLDREAIALYWHPQNQNLLYMVGGFSTAGGSTARGLAAWNTNTNAWVPLGFPGSGVDTMAVDNYGSIYALSNPWTYIYNGSWSYQIDTYFYDINTMFFDNSNSLYIGGDFTEFKNYPGFNRLAKLEGGLWKTTSSWINAGVNVIVYDNTTQLGWIGGRFSRIDGGGCAFIAQLNMSNSWAIPTLPTPAPTPNPTPVPTPKPTPVPSPPTPIPTPQPTPVPTPIPTATASVPTHSSTDTNPTTSLSPSNSNPIDTGSITTSSSGSSNIGMIVGIVVAIVLLLIGCIILVAILLIRKRKRDRGTEGHDLVPTNAKSQYANVPKMEGEKVEYSNFPNSTYENVPKGVKVTYENVPKGVKESEKAKNSYENVPAGVKKTEKEYDNFVLDSKLATKEYENFVPPKDSKLATKQYENFVPPKDSKPTTKEYENFVPPKDSKPTVKEYNNFPSQEIRQNEITPTENNRKNEITPVENNNKSMRGKSQEKEVTPVENK